MPQITRDKQNKTRNFIVSLSLLVLVVIGSTLAYFSSRDEVTNRFRASRFDLLLTETKWDPSSARDVVPGDELDKNPQVTNLEQTPGYIFLRVTVPCDVQKVENADGTLLGSTDASVPMYKFMVSDGNDPPSYAVNTEFSAAQTVKSCWTPVNTPAAQNFGTAQAPDWQIVYVYAYTYGDTLVSLLEGQTTPALFDKLKLWNFTEDFNPAQSHSVRVEALGIQADLPGYTSADIAGVWALLEEEGGA